MKVKICGITNKEDATNAISLGADAIGFIFYPDSPRAVTPKQVQEIIIDLPPFITTVGVFVNEEVSKMQEIAETCRLDILQLHGTESPNTCIETGKRVIKAIHISDPEDLKPIIAYQGTVSAILLDTKVENAFGGTGQSFDWGVAIAAKEFDIPLILSGGINTENVKKAATLVSPYAIDLCTGVESTPGKKDYNKLQEFIGLASNI